MDAPRIAPLPPSEWDDETREQLGRMLITPGGQPLNIFATIANHPKLLKRWLVFGTHVLAKSELPARDRELLILRTGWLCHAPYEWGQHVVIARREGISADEIERVAVGPDAPGWDEFDAALLTAADEMHSTGTITDRTWGTLSSRYDTHQLLEVPFTVGQYHLVAFALNACGVPLDPGVHGFAERPLAVRVAAAVLPVGNLDDAAACYAALLDRPGRRVGDRHVLDLGGTSIALVPAEQPASQPSTTAAVELAVDAPATVVARADDAGFTVIGDGAAATLADAWGNRIVLLDASAS
jgi:alkylhydroperoxidase family enzyme